MKIILAIASLLSAFASAPTWADEGAKCHFHGSKPAAESVVLGCANERKATLIKQGKLEASWKDIQPAKPEQSRRDDRPQIGHKIAKTDDPAPHERRRHSHGPEQQSDGQAKDRVDHRERRQIVRGRIDDILDHARGLHRAVETAAAADRRAP